ncbi:MAG: hypothetical protein HDQ98_03060 [Lachnospiraceae bacterium]|nr:hypothetical protein [Lachnospiraceae bacterium]
MGIQGVGTGYPAWGATGKWSKRSSGNGFADRMAVADQAGSFSFQGTGARTSAQNIVLQAYRAAASGAGSVKPVYQAYESANYKIVPDNEAGRFDIYNKQGEKLGVFQYSDIKVRQDSATGKEFLISEYGTMSYEAMVMDNELKDALQNAMGVEKLETEELQGFTLKTHSGTGIQYLLRDGVEGRGGKVLLQSQADIQKYEALAETYYRKYPNLVQDKKAGYIWADLEIRGLAVQSGGGILSVHYDGMSYNHNSDYKKNWCIRFSGDTYSNILDWIQKNRGRMEEMHQFSVWDQFFSDRGMRYERIWSKEEELQGYLNN